MKWQEYQDAVGELYKRMEELGNIKKNITIPDRISGQPRQVDVWWEITGKGHKIGILIDAKLRKSVVDVKDVEEILALAKSVNANKAIIVTNNGWTEPAMKVAEFENMDIRLFTIDEALECIVEDYWKLCPHCENDCIVMDSNSAFEYGGLIFWSLGGRCRECKSAIAWCQDCGWKDILAINEKKNCWCEHEWGNEQEGMYIRFDAKDNKFFL